MSESSRQLTGVIVHVRNFGESHRIVEFLSEEYGRIDLLARGARASRKRFAGCLDLFIALRVTVNTRGKIWALNSADILNARVGIRQKLPAIERAMTLCETARLLTAENAAAPEILLALNNALNALDGGDIALAVAAYPHMLRAAGLLPELDRCVRCQGGEYPMALLEGAIGGAVCARCAGGGVSPWSAPLHAALAGAPCDDASIAERVERIYIAYIEAQLERPLRSRDGFTTPRR